MNPGSSVVACYRDGLYYSAANRGLVGVGCLAVLFSHLAETRLGSLRKSVDILLPWARQIAQGRLVALSPQELLAAVEPASMVAMFLGLSGLVIGVGLTAIMRDLLVQHDYALRDTPRYGVRYLVPMMLFKIPIYLVFSLVVLGLAYVAGVTPGRPIPELLCHGRVWVVGGLALLVFVPVRALLSLGSKFIVLRNPRTTSEVWRTVLALLCANSMAAIVFYALQIPFAGLTTALALSPLWASGAWHTFGLAVTLGVLGFVGSFIKLSSFLFFLRLLGTDTTTNGASLNG